MPPTISVLMAYHNRLTQLRNTLRSYQHFYGVELEGIELVMVNDTPTDPEELNRLCEELGIDPARHLLQCVEREGAHNPGELYNMAGDSASASLLAITNPENLHLGPVLTHAQAQWAAGQYLVYGCRSLRSVPDDWQELLRNPEPHTSEWYQHTERSNRRLHFMTVIGTEEFRSIRFDPAYNEGHAYEDNDFVRRIEQAGLTIHCFDTPTVAHQPHERRWGGPLMEKNRIIYEQKWGR